MALAFKADRSMDAPATHVLIVGIDKYPWLGQVLPGIKSLSSCCNSAMVFYNWMTERFRNGGAPLGTVRLLLSPTEESCPGHVLSQEIEIATRDTFFQELVAWAEDLSRNRDSIGIFYFSGHGFGAGFDQRVLAMSDAGQTEFAPFQACVSFDNIYVGLAPNDRRPNMARQQYFFLDCGSPTSSISHFLERNASQLFAIPSLSRMDDREAVTYSAAGHGGLAWARPNDITFFTSALIKSLEGSGAQPSHISSYDLDDWVVTASSLANGLNFEGERLRAEHNHLDLDIQFPMSGVGLSNSDSVLHELSEPPKVLIRIYLDKLDEPDLTVVLKNPLGSDELCFSPDVIGNEKTLEITAPAGFYKVQARSAGEPIGKPLMMLARPPLMTLQL